MPHIILGCLDTMRGNASSGVIYELREVASTLIQAMENENIPGAYDLIEEIETWACTGGNYELGAAAQAAAYRDQCSALLK